ncbi:glycosyltransferase family 4 protein [Agrococcus sp. DT81.2]|uniref:glycosyltransferase family 4 protein n=1 Tax=Agrococcus sp. DT81.2 TaxID=3393414 RepID=UPI003CE52365
MHVRSSTRTVSCTRRSLVAAIRPRKPDGIGSPVILARRRHRLHRGPQMKLVYIHQYFSAGDAPTGIRSLKLAGVMAERGHDVHIVTSTAARPGPPPSSPERLQDITVHWVPLEYSNSMAYSRRILAFVNFAVRATGVARRLKGDLVFATSTPLTVIIPAWIATLGRGTPIVFEVRDLWPELPIAMGALRSRALRAAARWLERFAYRKATRIVALSPGMREGVLKVETRRPVELIPNMSYLDLFNTDSASIADWLAANEWLGNRKMILYCGTLGRINRVSYLVDVADAMREIDPSICFVVVGGGAEEALIRERAANSGVLGFNFYMLGPIAKRDVPPIYGAASLCTSLFMPLPEMEANSANKFFDALAAGRPVAVNYGGWQAELIKQENAGIALDPSNPRLAAEALHTLVSDGPELQRMGQNAHALARSNFSLDVLGPRFAEVLEGALEEGVPRGHGGK